MTHRPRMPLAPLTVLTTVVIVACSGGAPASSAPGASSAAGGDARVPVTVTEAGCAPAALQATAGRVVCEVRNGGLELDEFEVVSGTTDVDEVENMVPGFVVNLASHLGGGTYELICYAKRSPRAALTVSGEAAAQPSSDVVDAVTLTKYRDEYAAYVRAQATELTTQLAPFVAAIQAGDLAA